MEREDFVTYEQAKALKELGFEHPCTHGYYEFKNKEPWLNTCDYANNTIGGDFFYYSAPTLYQVQKWLREDKDVSVTIRIFTFDDNGPMYCADVCKINREEKHLNLICGPRSNSYEGALSLGIDKALDFLNGKIDILKI